MLNSIDEATIRNSFVQLNDLALRRIYSVSEVHLRNHRKANIFNYLNLTAMKDERFIRLLMFKIR